MLAEINRRNASIVRPWRVAPNHHASFDARNRKIVDDSKRLAAIAHEGLAHCWNIDEARTLHSEAFFVGRKYGMILWEPVTTSLDGSPEMEWWLPYKIQDIDRRRMHWVPDWIWIKPDGKREMLKSGPRYDYGAGRDSGEMRYPQGGYLAKSGIHLEMFNTNSYQWQRVSEEQRVNLIEYTYYDSEDRVGHGRGVMEAGLYTHYMLTNTDKKIGEGIDRYANGVLTMTLDSLRNASTGKTNADLLAAAKNVLNTYRSEHYIILNDGDKIEVQEVQGSGISFSMDFRDHLVASWARLCNGSARPAGHSVDGTGARAQAETESDSSEGFYQNDRATLDHVYDRDLLGAFLYHNQENIEKLGLGKTKRPKFSSQQVKRQNPSERVAVLNASRVPILKTEYYEGIDCTPTSPEDDVVEPMAMQGDIMNGGPAFNDKGDRGEGRDGGKRESA